MTAERDPWDDRTPEDDLLCKVMMAAGAARSCDPEARVVLLYLLDAMEAGTVAELALLISTHYRPLKTG